LLHEELSRRGFDTWIDWEDIPPSSEWMQEIFSAIEKADTFIIILSPKSVKSKVCGIEVEHAIKNHKRIIPIVLSGVKDQDVVKELNSINWIYFNQPDNQFTESINKLLESIHTDLEWVKEHTRIQVRALEWELKNKDASLFLRGTDLVSAEKWQISGAEKNPGITRLQVDFIQQSRRHATNQLRLFLSLMVFALVAIALLTIWAFYQKSQVTIESNSRATAESMALVQRDEAVQQANIALSNLAVLQVERNNESSVVLNSLLSVEAYNAYKTAGALNLLVQTLEIEPRLLTVLYGHSIWVSTLSVNPITQQLVSGGGEGLAMLWDLGELKQSGINLVGHSGSILASAFSSDGHWLVTGDTNGEIFLWNIENNQLIDQFEVSFSGWIEQIVFVKSEMAIAIRSSENEFILLDLMNHQTEIVDFTGVDPKISKIQLSPNGDLVAVATCGENLEDETCLNPSISIWDLEKRDFVGDSLFGQTQRITAMTFSSDQSMVAAGSEDFRVVVWSMVDKAVTFTQIAAIDKDMIGEGEPVGIINLAFNSTGSLLAGTNGNFQDVRDKGYSPIIVWDLIEEEMIGAAIVGPESATHYIVFY